MISWNKLNQTCCCHETGLKPVLLIFDIGGYQYRYISELPKSNYSKISVPVSIQVDLEIDLEFQDWSIFFKSISKFVRALLKPKLAIKVDRNWEGGNKDKIQAEQGRQKP